MIECCSFIANMTILQEGIWRPPRLVNRPHHTRPPHRSSRFTSRTIGSNNTPLRHFHCSTQKFIAVPALPITLLDHLIQNDNDKTRKMLPHSISFEHELDMLPQLTTTRPPKFPRTSPGSPIMPLPSCPPNPRNTGAATPAHEQAACSETA